MADDISVDADDSSWSGSGNSSGEQECPETPTATLHSSTATLPTPSSVCNGVRNRGKQVDYVNEKHDNEFAEAKGYTHFGRTRKGGDKRPNAPSVEPPKKTISAVTMLNFFATPGKRPRPRPNAVIDLCNTSKKMSDLSTRTRTLWGRPAKSSVKDTNISTMASRVKRTATDGGLAVAPTPRRKWKGAVRCLFALFVLFLFSPKCKPNL